MTHQTETRPAAAPPPTTPASTASGGGRWTVRRAGALAGVALLVMTVSAVFAYFVVVIGMITPGDPAATAAEIVAKEGTFRLGVLAWLLVVVLDVVVAWALFIVFRPVSPAVSMLAAAFRLVYTAVLLAAVAQLLRGLDVLADDSSVAALSPEAVSTHALLELSGFQHLYDAGLLLFGMHLALLGYLALRSGYVPRVIGALLVVAGAGYAVDTVIVVLALDVPFRVAAFTSLGELLLGLWLLLAGRRLRVVGTTQVAEVRRAH